MRTRIMVTLLLLTLWAVGWVAAQKSDNGDKPIWTLEVMKIRPEKFGPALGYLDEHWMRLRKEAKKEGVILNYSRFVEATPPFPGGSDRNSIFLLTEYKNQAAFAARDQVFASIQQRMPDSRPGLLAEEGNPEEIYGPTDMTVLWEEPDNRGAQLKLLAKQ